MLPEYQCISAIEYQVYLCLFDKTKDLGLFSLMGYQPLWIV